ncbi:MAG TPA: DUF2703 domain-containing protein [Caldisericia bacterium]|nr:DUF2703 domain-containing protein [Caldisericia bacterium]HRV75664.1 DUF2703 domain-containing protein [Caldisericia bacterium]
METLEIVWRRLVSDGKTCKRCEDTEDQLYLAVSKLRGMVLHLNTEVVIQKEEISEDEFGRNPLLSNQILINGKPLEEWVEGKTGASQCCDVCGDNDCRTVSVDGNEYETIPSELIVKAGLTAALSMQSLNVK